jgi:prepilin peptidase CpaA
MYRVMELAAVHPSSPALVVLLGGLVVASVSDVRERRIPDWLVGTLALGGFVSVVASSYGTGTVARSIGTALLAGLLGFAIWLPSVVSRRLGAGDLKLFAAAAVWLSPLIVARAFIWTALAGGVLGIAWWLTARSRPASPDLDPVRAARVAKVPYGVAMSVGIATSIAVSALMRNPWPF